MKLNSILFLQKGHQYLLKNTYVENAHKIDHVIMKKWEHNRFFFLMDSQNFKIPFMNVEFYESHHECLFH